MAEYSRLILTNKGKTLFAKILGGSVEADIDFTRIVVSSAVYALDELEGLIELADIEQSSLISGKEISDKISVKLRASFHNVELVKGYYMHTIGVYAVDPDEGEILYAVTIETSGNCYMPPYNGRTISEVSITLITAIANAENVLLEVNPEAVATVSDIENLKEQIGAISAGVLDTLEEIEANTEKGAIAGALAIKELHDRMGTVLEAILTTGATSVTFTDPAITKDSTIDIYTTKYGAEPSEAPIYDEGTNTLTVTFDVQAEDMGVKVIVR